MRYYILRAQGENDVKSAKEATRYSFNINNINAERFLSDLRDEPIEYLLYCVTNKKFIEHGVISDISVDRSSKNFQAHLSPKKNLDIYYTPYASPNCRIIPTNKNKMDELLSI